MGTVKGPLFTLRVTSLLSSFTDEEMKPFLPWDVKHFQSHMMLRRGIGNSVHCALRCVCLSTCARVSGHRRQPGSVWTSWCPSLLPVSRTQSSFTAVGTFTEMPHCPGTDYLCYVVVIIKLIIFLTLQICYFIFHDVFLCVCYLYTLTVLYILIMRYIFDTGKCHICF